MRPLFSCLQQGLLRVLLRMEMVALMGTVVLGLLLLFSWPPPPEFRLPKLSRDTVRVKVMLVLEPVRELLLLLETVGVVGLLLLVLMCYQALGVVLLLLRYLLLVLVFWALPGLLQ